MWDKNNRFEQPYYTCVPQYSLIANIINNHYATHIYIYITTEKKKTWATHRTGSRHFCRFLLANNPTFKFITLKANTSVLRVQYVFPEQSRGMEKTEDETKTTHSGDRSADSRIKAKRNKTETGAGVLCSGTMAANRPRTMTKTAVILPRWKQ